MKTKTIKRIISSKINAWLKTIDNTTVRELAEKNTIVTGGAIASMLLGESAKDFDIYFRNKETALEVAQYYVSKFRETHDTDIMVQDEEDRVRIHIPSIGVAAESTNLETTVFEDVYDVLNQEPSTEDSKKDEFRPIFLSSNAITLSNKVQIIIRFFGEPEEIHSNYDFVHCTNYYDHGTKKVILKPLALESLLTKELIYKGSKYPICSIIRTRKFISRGFTINAGEYLKMCFQVSELDLTDIEVLEDQLVGVDSAYFGMLIEALKQKTRNNPNFKITGNYLYSLIEKIF